MHVTIAPVSTLPCNVAGFFVWNLIFAITSRAFVWTLLYRVHRDIKFFLHGHHNHHRLYLKSQQHFDSLVGFELFASLCKPFCSGLAYNKMSTSVSLAGQFSSECNMPAHHRHVFVRLGCLYSPVFSAFVFISVEDFLFLCCDILFCFVG